MIELEFLDIHPDETRLILTDPDGQRYSLPITDTLRNALRPARPTLQAVASTQEAPSPRDIQAFIRQGSTIEQIAEEFSVPTESIRKFERPILDERRYISSMAQKTAIDSEPGSPQLQDLVVDRLAARGIDPDTIRWDAIRIGTEPWEVIVHFIQSAVEKEAHWHFDMQGKSLTALDQEAIWLTETAIPSSSDPFGISKPLPWELPEAPPPPDEYSSGGKPEPSFTKVRTPQETTVAHMPGVGTEALLDELNSQRGIRQSIDMSEFEDEPGELQTAQLDMDVSSDESAKQSSNSDDVNQVVPLHHKDRNQATAEQSDVSEDDEADEDTVITPVQEAETSEAEEDLLESPQTEVLPGFENFTAGKAPTRKSRRTKKRRSVPSWDEIVFGARAQDKD